MIKLQPLYRLKEKTTSVLLAFLCDFFIWQPLYGSENLYVYTYINVFKCMCVSIDMYKKTHKVDYHLL